MQPGLKLVTFFYCIMDQHSSVQQNWQTLICKKGNVHTCKTGFFNIRFTINLSGYNCTNLIKSAKLLRRPCTG